MVVAIYLYELLAFTATVAIYWIFYTFFIEKEVTFSCHRPPGDLLWSQRTTQVSWAAVGRLKFTFLTEKNVESPCIWQQCLQHNALYYHILLTYNRAAPAPYYMI